MIKDNKNRLVTSPTKLVVKLGMKKEEAISFLAKFT